MSGICGVAYRDRDRLPDTAVFIAKPYGEQVPTTAIRTLLKKSSAAP